MGKYGLHPLIHTSPAINLVPNVGGSSEGVRVQIKLWNARFPNRLVGVADQLGISYT